MSMVTSYISKFVDFTKTQKSRYIENETFFLQTKIFITYTSRATLWQKNAFVSGVPFKGIEKRAKLKKIDIHLVLRIL